MILLYLFLKLSLPRKMYENYYMVFNRIVVELLSLFLHFRMFIHTLVLDLKFQNVVSGYQICP